MALALFLLFTCALNGIPIAQAAQKEVESRAIGIVFDNSGSMYKDKELAWSRATYAMEVFASMLNKGDVLQIYPMHPITVNNVEYTMQSPFTITDASKASLIREIYTPNPLGTPIETMDWAAQGLRALKADKKYMLVLTDGDSFYLNNVKMTESESVRQMDARVQAYAGSEMSVMYLGIGKNVIMPSKAETEHFAKKQAKNSEDVLSVLTVLCNQIFGRDTLTKKYISGQKINFDISMSKLIVFVQGENVSQLTVTDASGKPVGNQISSSSTKYSTQGNGLYKDFVSDTSLQGMMVTYEDCAAGSYTVNYTGTATSMEVYYEPNADLDFVFTDADGNTVDPSTLYEGEYKVSFGMKDAKTGKLISSDLLGNPQYQGSYSVNGKTYPITHNGYNGEERVTLSMDDTFEANLTVTYLSGYTIKKDSTDFGWPKLGIKVAARPAGELKLKISGGDSVYYLEELEDGASFRAEVLYQGKKLTGAELKKVVLDWNEADSKALIKTAVENDCYVLSLRHRNAADPQKTSCGSCTVPIRAAYTAKGSNEAKTQASLSYEIAAARPAGELQLEISGGDELYSLQDLKDGAPYIAKVFYQGEQLKKEELSKVILEWDPETSNAKLEQTLQDDHFEIRLHYKDPAAPQDTVCGECTVAVGARYTAPGCFESLAEAPLTYNIRDDWSPLQLELSTPEDYIVISKLDESRPITVLLTLNNEPLPPAEFAATQVQVDCGGIRYELTPDAQSSSYTVKLLSTEGIEKGDYKVRVEAQHTDHIGRVSETAEDAVITLGTLPIWLKLLLWLLLLLLLFIIIWLILHIRVLPKSYDISKHTGYHNFGGEDVSQNTKFRAALTKGTLTATAQYAGQKYGVTMKVTPGRESYLYKPSHKRSVLVDPNSIRKIGPATLQDVLLGSAKYELDENGAKLVPAMQNQKPFELRHGSMIKYSGTILNAGVDTDVDVTMKPNFKKTR